MIILYTDMENLISDKLKFLKKKPQKSIVIGNDINLKDILIILLIMKR